MLKTTKGHRALLPCSLNDIDSVANLCSNAASFYQSTPVVQRQFFAFGAGVEASAQQFAQGLRAGGRRSLQTKASSPWALTSQNAPKSPCVYPTKDLDTWYDAVADSMA